MSNSHNRRMRRLERNQKMRVKNKRKLSNPKPRFGPVTTCYMDGCRTES